MAGATAAADGTPALLAAAPIAVVLLLMLAWHWSAARAGGAGLLLALGIAALAFGFGADTPALPQYAGVAAEGAFTAATILWILWPALALHHLQQHSGALDTVRDALARLTPHPALQILLIGWFMGLFFEGAAGFGTPIALAAPLLAGLGVPPVQAVVLALLGNGVGSSFGALGTPALAQAALTGLDAQALAGRTALLHALTSGLLMLFFVRAMALAGPAATATATATATVRPATWGLFAALGYLLPSLAIAALLGPELATLGAALAGGLLFAAAIRLHAGAARAGQPPVTGLARALSPYLVLTALVVATRLVPPLREPLAQIRLEWRWLDQFNGLMLPLLHPGTLLFVALLSGAALQRAPAEQIGQALGAGARRLVPVAVALLAMLCLSRLMLHAGMVAALERAAVRGLGEHWPWVAPSVGALGAFVTGSATASNVLFTSLQAQAAHALALPVVLVVAAQNFGAAAGNIICPHNIVAGAATVGLAGRESEVLRQTLLPCALLLLAGGAVLAWLVERGIGSTG